MRPDVGRRKPIIQLSSVLLPLPFMPSRATSSPSRTSRLMSRSTATAPYPACKPSTTSLFTEIHLLNLGTSDDLVRIAFGDDRAGFEADHALREAHDRMHDMFYHHHRDTGFVQREKQRQHVVDFRLRKPC